MEHLRQIVGAVHVPVNADFENCFADDPDAVAMNVKLAVATGVAGLSIEDSTGDADEPLYPFERAVERVRAARQAIDESGSGVVAEAASLGVRRIGVGGTLAHTAWAGFLAAAEEIATEGTFTRFVDPPNVDAIFSS